MKRNRRSNRRRLKRSRRPIRRRLTKYDDLVQDFNSTRLPRRYYCDYYPVCPKCHKKYTVTRNGSRVRKLDTIQRYRCGRCRITWPESHVRQQKRKNINICNLTKKFILGRSTLASIAQDAGMSPSGLLNRIVKYKAKLPTVLGESKRLDLGKKCKVMGIDITFMKKMTLVKKKNRMIKKVQSVPLLYVVDNISGDTIYFHEIESKKKKVVRGILEMLRKKLGLNPLIITTDLAKELIFTIHEKRTIANEIRGVFPQAIIQGSLFHAYLLFERELPTRKRIEALTKANMDLRKRAKFLMLKTIIAVDDDNRAQLISKLRDLDLTHDDGKGTVAKTIRQHLNNLVKYYHPPNVLRSKLGTDDLRPLMYNNTCESHFRVPKALSKKMRSWSEKNLDAYIFFKRQEGRAKQILRLKRKYFGNGLDRHLFPITLFLKITDHFGVDEFCDAGLSIEDVRRAADATENPEINGEIFWQSYLDKIEEHVEEKKKPFVYVKDVCRSFSLDRAMALNVMRYLGFLVNPSGRKILKRKCLRCHETTTRKLKNSARTELWFSWEGQFPFCHGCFHKLDMRKRKKIPRDKYRKP